MSSHHQRKRTYLCRPQQIRIRGSLGPSLHNALVYRPQLIHMVALVGTGACIHKGEHSGDQQSGLVMSHRVRSGEYRACLTVLSLAVAEKERIRSGISMTETAGLSDETSGECHSILDGRPAGNDEIIPYHPYAYMDRSIGIAVYASVLQPRGPLYLAAVPYPDVLYISGIRNHHIGSDPSGPGCHRSHIFPDQFLQ